MKYRIGNAHPEGQLGTGEQSRTKPNLTRTPYHASDGTASEFHSKGLADTAFRSDFPRTDLNAACEGWVSTNPAPEYDKRSLLSTFCFADGRSPKLDWSHLPPLTTDYPTHWDRFWPYGKYLGTELLCLFYADPVAPSRLCAHRSLFAPIDAELIRDRPRKWLFQNALRGLLSSKLVEAMDGSVVVHMDPDGALGVPHIRMPLTEHLRARVILRDGLVCQICTSDILDDQFDIDHIVPVVEGGLNVLENLRVTHKRCNRSRRRSPSKRIAAKRRLTAVQP